MLLQTIFMLYYFMNIIIENLKVQVNFVMLTSRLTWFKVLFVYPTISVLIAFVLLLSRSIYVLCSFITFYGESKCQISWRFPLRTGWHYDEQTSYPIIWFCWCVLWTSTYQSETLQALMQPSNYKFFIHSANLATLI